MKKTILKTLCIIFLFASNPILSHPRFGLLYKDKCGNCHLNPTGGTMRNLDGFNFGKNVISMYSSSGKEIPISPKLSSTITFGFDYRTQFLYSGEKKKGDFQDMSGSVYFNAAVSEKINIQTRYDFVQSIWEGFAVAKILPNDSYLKAGSFAPDFGIKLDDHTAYTRGGDFGLLFSTGAVQGLIFNPYYTITGIEIGVNINQITFLTASLGKAKNNGTFTSDPAFTSRLEISPQIGNFQLMFGASLSTTKTRKVDLNTGITDLLPTSLYGGFAGIGIDRFTIMGEYDIGNDYTGRGVNSTALMIEASYKLLTGLDAVIRYDRFLPDKNINENYFSHLVLGTEFYPYSFIQIIPQYRINMNGDNNSSNSFLVQFHFWY